MSTEACQTLSCWTLMWAWKPAYTMIKSCCSGHSCVWKYSGGENVHDLLQHHGNWYIWCAFPSVCCLCHCPASHYLQPCAGVKCSAVSPTVVPNVCLFNRNSFLIKKLSKYILLVLNIHYKWQVWGQLSIFFFFFARMQINTEKSWFQKKSFNI